MPPIRLRQEQLFQCPPDCVWPAPLSACVGTGKAIFMSSRLAGHGKIHTARPPSSLDVESRQPIALPLCNYCTLKELALRRGCRPVILTWATPAPQMLFATTLREATQDPALCHFADSLSTTAAARRLRRVLLKTRGREQMASTLTQPCISSFAWPPLVTGRLRSAV